MRKRLFIKLAAIAATMLLMLQTAASCMSTSYTYFETINRNYERSQDAYVPSGIYMHLGLKDASDLFVLGSTLYIADTGNKRILVLDKDTEEVTVIGEGILSEPTGVAADSQGRIYVADYANKEAYRFSKNGELEFTFTKPTSPNFGKGSYNPKKIAPTDDGGVYIVSEGSTAGILLISGNGLFLGYFASNNVQMSLFERIRDIFLTDSQKAGFIRRTPPSFGNILRAEDGLVYTTNLGQFTDGIKKLSIAGLNMLENRIILNEPADLCVSVDGRMMVLDNRGSIYELTADGVLICAYAGSSDKTDTIGLFELATGLGTDHDGNVYVLDSVKNYIQVFSPTTFMAGIHKALNDYNDGNYDESLTVFKDVLRLNDVSFLAHYYTGKNYLQKADYDSAINHFKIANARGSYSDAYWEIRNIWLQKYLGYIIVGIGIFYVLYEILSRLNKKFKFYQSKGSLKKLLQYRFIFDISRLKHQLFHPNDNAYDVKVKTTGTYASATFIYALLLALAALQQVGSGFIFSAWQNDFSVVNFLGYFIGIIALFIIGNFFISAINEGNGTLRTIYVGVAYSFAPAIFILPIIILFSNVATRNEAFLVNFAMGGVIVWVAINIFLTIIEIHEYSFKQSVINIFLTLFFMAVAVLVFSMLYLLVMQVVNFGADIVTEVMLRVRT